ncbi:uncharacterized protein [Fopius arisanus]|uniref:Uncharacterized protein isoform X2 n=1 Tax=Fopius arisanus TaxID=64838 RepID=A0A9R1TY70_9HYME|nr:PREDICTED: uncharacterized protein LOC105264914 isoform X2 [Fopius arisanus]
MSAPSLHIRGVKIHRHLLKYMFPQVINGEIDTNKFLNASRNFIQIIDKFGKVFIPLKYDMQNNIEKLSQRYNANKSSHASLQSLILSENNTEKNSVTAEALLWLTRSLQLRGTITTRRISHRRLMSRMMRSCLATLLAKSIPTCSQILLSLGENTPDAKVTTINTLDIISKQMQSNLIILNKFLYVNDIGQVF